MGEYGPEILVVEQKKAFVVGELERETQHTFLGVVQFENPAEQHRPHLRDGRPHRMALCAEHVPEHGRRGAISEIGHAECGRTRLQFRAARPWLTDPGEVAFDVGAEHRDAVGGKVLSEHLEGDGLAGSGGARDQPVPVREGKREPNRHITDADRNRTLVARGLIHAHPILRFPMLPERAADRYRQRKQPAGRRLWGDRAIIVAP